MREKQIMLLFNRLLVMAAPLLYFATFLNTDFARNFYSYGGYYLICGLFILWIISIMQCAWHEKFSIKSWLSSYKIGILVSIVIIAVVFLSIKPILRVLADETNLLGVSKSMVYGKRTDNVTMGKWYYDNFYPLSGGMDKRPLLFPFFTSLIHSLLGYRAENVFILNALVLFSLLLLIYINMKNAFGEIWGISSVIILASQPMVIQCATSGGFDLLSSLFLVICFCCLKAFLEKPLSVLRFRMLWASLLMFSSVRYEGAASFFLAILILALLRYIKIGFFKEGINVIYFYTPMALLSNYLAAVLIANPLQVEEAKNATAFALEYFIKNNIYFCKSLVDYHFSLPYAAIVNAIGIVAIFYFTYRFFEGKYSKNNSRMHLIAISAICLLLNLTFYTSCYAGLSNHPSLSRYFLSYVIVLSILAVMLMYSIDFFKKRPVYVILFSIAMFILYHPVSVEDRFSRTQTLPREYRFVMYYLEQEGRKDNNSFVVVTSRPGMYTVHNYGAVDFNNANNRDDLLNQFNNRLFSDIFVVQSIEYKTQKPAKGYELNKKYVLKTIAEGQIDSEKFIRISRVLRKPLYIAAEPAYTAIVPASAPQQK